MLGRIPASVRFVSAEPLLDRLDLTHWIEDGTLHWIIAGGESGPSARPMDIDWVRDLRDQAAKAHIAFFFKQLGGRRGKRSGEQALLDGTTWTSMPEFNRDKEEYASNLHNLALEDHTVGKHRVLQRYLEAWLPIMLRSNERVLFVDAFAGPGEYTRGEKGSPVIALEAFLSHSSRNLMTGDLSFVFIEKDPPRAQHLKRVS